MVELYLYSVAVLEICCVVVWLLNYVEWKAHDDRQYLEWAHEALLWIPRILIWPHFLVKAVIRALQETVREDARWD